MKRFKLFAGSAALLVGLTFVGCEKFQGPVSTDDTSGAGLILVASPDAVPSEIVTEASSQTEFVLSAPESDRKMEPLNGIFRRLKLTAGQDSLIRSYMKAQHDCVKMAMDSLRNSEKSIRRAAEAQRKAIVDQLKAGTITRAEAAVQMKQLNDATRTALQNNPVREWAKTEMERCRLEFNTAVRAALTPEQQTIWDQFIANAKTGGPKADGPKDPKGPKDGGPKDPKGPKDGGPKDPKGPKDGGPKDGGPKDGGPKDGGPKGGGPKDGPKGGGQGSDSTSTKRP